MLFGWLCFVHDLAAYDDDAGVEIALACCWPCHYANGGDDAISADGQRFDVGMRGDASEISPLRRMRSGLGCCA
jgi:hypothetical protein